EAVAAAVVEMQVGVDDIGDVARDVLGVWRRAHILDLGPRVDHAGVDQHTAGGVVDCPDEHGQLFAVGEELCREVGADHVPTLLPEGRLRLYDRARSSKILVITIGSTGSARAAPTERASGQPCARILAAAPAAS